MQTGQTAEGIAMAAVNSVNGLNTMSPLFSCLISDHTFDDKWNFILDLLLIA
jgi:hypothetical protein